MNTDELVERIHCDQSWPVCFLDISFQNVVHDFFVFTCDY